jgi:hypothetical protein
MLYLVEYRRESSPKHLLATAYGAGKRAEQKRRMGGEKARPLFILSG